MALTEKQKNTLAKHKKHHTAKHMAMMRKLMNKGKSFTAAHKIAMKEVGAWNIQNTILTMTNLVQGIK